MTDDLFGNHPDRPDKIEFWHLSEIILGLDATTDDDTEATIESVVGHIIPPDVAAYVAVQRASRALLSLESSRVTAQDLLALLSAAWIDGFTAGGTFAKKYPEDGVT